MAFKFLLLVVNLSSFCTVPDAETGVRWDDPSLAIPWPLPVSQVSDRDRDLPFLPL